MECGSWCVYHSSRGVSGACKNCSAYVHEQPQKLDLGSVNIFELAEGLKKKRQEQNNEKPEPELNTSKQNETLAICPNCKKLSFFNNHYEKKSECLNLECQPKKVDIFEKIIWVHEDSSATPDLSSPTKKEGLSDPLLLGVKMFLADIRSWRRQYREGEYVCSDFAKEVFDSATERGIRCGYVVIDFEKSEISHAVVAFDTDYGLVFIEPQNGEIIEVRVGKSYSTSVGGVPEQDIIRVIHISWNDGTSTVKS